MKRTTGKRLFAFCMVTCLVLGGYFAQPASAAGQEVVVFAAASTTSAVTDIAALYASKGLGEVKTSFASSSTLAKQIEQGAPAGVFLSANQEWMDYIEKKDLVVPGSRANLLRNRIVLIVPNDSKAADVKLAEKPDLLALLGKDGKLSVGDPAHVPVGMYGKQALESLGLWKAIEDRVAPAKDVRAGLALVERGEAPLGLVYESDAALSEKVRIIGIFPAGSHPDVIYPVGVVKGDQAEAAAKFAAFLQTPESLAIFAKYGFAGM
jgi:molybdenum ABC transporter, periplasmic molybdate-binding protein